MCCLHSKPKVTLTSLCLTAAPTAIPAKAKADIANESVQSYSFLLYQILTIVFFNCRIENPFIFMKFSISSLDQKAIHEFNSKGNLNV
jgi:hypothetical protein